MPALIYRRSGINQIFLIKVAVAACGLLLVKLDLITEIQTNVAPCAIPLMFSGRVDSLQASQPRPLTPTLTQGH